MKSVLKASLCTLGLALSCGNAAQAYDRQGQECSVRALAGRWMFATDVGKQTFFPGGDITAIGTFRADRYGKVQGVFDATVAGWMFLPGLTFTGAFNVNPDCTGTLSFTTGAGTTRTDSIVIVGDLIRGMSQDTQFLWTYEMKRLGSPR